MIDLVIIGSGPAGLAAAMYALRRELDVLVLSRSLGGKTRNVVHFPGHDDFVVIKAKEQVEIYKNRLNYVADTHRECEVLSLEKTKQGFRIHTRAIGSGGAADTVHEAKAVIVATGLVGRSLGVRGETQFWGKGLGSNAVSYAHIFDGERVFLYGDSPRVLEAAKELSWHASEITLALAPGYQPDAAALASLEKRDGLRILKEVTIHAFKGDEACRSVEIESPQGKEDIEAEGFFNELEPLAALDFMDGLADRGPDGHLLVDNMHQSSVPGLFGAGDVCSGSWQQVLIALGSGATAGLEAIRYLHKG